MVDLHRGISNTFFTQEYHYFTLELSLELLQVLGALIFCNVTVKLKKNLKCVWNIFMKFLSMIILDYILRFCNSF